MFTTVEQVKEITGYDVTQEIIIAAQAMIESYVGRLEAEITNAHDMLLLGRATAYQAGYIEDTEGLARVMSQMKVAYMLEFGNSVSFVNDGYSPWIFQMAAVACKGLSWNRIRSIKTGSIFNQKTELPRWETT